MKKIQDVNNIGINMRAKFQRKVICIVGYIKKYKSEFFFNFLNYVLFTTQINLFFLAHNTTNLELKFCTLVYVSTSGNFFL